MYPSGQWEGFWFQEAHGKQRMTAFTLWFTNGEITGDGSDVIGGFTFTGGYDIDNGELVMMKQYVGKHRVLYRGKPDGEGCIAGTWSIGGNSTGPFMLKPVLQRPHGGEPIEEIE